MPDQTDEKPKADPSTFKISHAADNPIDENGKTARDREREGTQGAEAKQEAPSLEKTLGLVEQDDGPLEKRE